jgi:hypothetical protein
VSVDVRKVERREVGVCVGDDNKLRAVEDREGVVAEQLSTRLLGLRGLVLEVDVVELGVGQVELRNPASILGRACVRRSVVGVSRGVVRDLLAGHCVTVMSAKQKLRRLLNIHSHCSSTSRPGAERGTVRLCVMAGVVDSPD